MEKIETSRLILKQSQPYMADLVLDFYERNKSFLTPFEAKRDEGFYTVSYQEKCLLFESTICAINGSAYRYYIFLKGDETKIIGTISINNIIRSCFQSALIGYKLDENFINNGYMTEALEAVIKFAFKELKLHRVEANVMPWNLRSQRVLGKLKFANEGLAKNFIEINGKWEDHIRFSLVNENFE
ncbi:MAG: GNAT family N-acetyltransferase [Oscillospiraceae bacterium]